MAEKNQKFMQSLDNDVYRQLVEMAEERGISIQELVRAVIIPEWMRLLKQTEKPGSDGRQKSR